jgi:signal transduction histidine kinase
MSLIHNVINFGLNAGMGSLPEEIKARVRLTNYNGMIYFVLDLVLAGCFYLVLDDPYISYLLTMSGLSFLFSSVGLNHLGFTNLSRISTVSIGSILVMACSLYLGKETNAHGSLLLGAVFPFLYFSTREIWKITLTIFVPIACFSILIKTNYNWGHHQQQLPEITVIVLSSIFMGVPFFGIVANMFFLKRTTETQQMELIEAAEQIKSLLRLVCHDMATPLMIMMNAKDLLAMADLNEKSHKHLGLMGRSINKMVEILQVVKDMLAYEDGKTMVNMSHCDISDIISRACLDFG